jgi:hypothetical protein
MDILKDLKGCASKCICFAILLITCFEGVFSLYGQSSPVQIPKIKYLCANTDNISIAWEPSTTPGVKYYTLYYKYVGLNPHPDWKEIQGLQVPATANPYYTFSPLVMSEVDVAAEPVAFAVQAHTDTTESLVDDRFWGMKWDSTMFLQGSYSTCLASIKLSWNPYDFNMWGHNTREYRVYTSENGAPPVLNTTVPANQDTCVLTNLIANNNYDIFIAAIPSSGKTSDSATSTALKINTSMAMLPQYIYADYATCKDNNVEVLFSIDPYSELDLYKVLRSGSVDGPYDTIADIHEVTAQINFTDNVDCTSGPYYYKLEAINHCKVAIRESRNIASSILLVNDSNALTPSLTWNNYEQWINGVSGYSVERKFGDGEFESIANISSLSFNDDLRPFQGTGTVASVCYRISATENDNISGVNALSQSNTICIELPVNIRFEFDAFSPGNSMGNNSFGPSIDYIPDHFEFKVLSRGGMVMFETFNALNPRWDGRYKGSLVPAGAYMYVLQYQMNGGRKHTLRGGVVVVYP